MLSYVFCAFWNRGWYNLNNCYFFIKIQKKCDLPYSIIPKWSLWTMHCYQKINIELFLRKSTTLILTNRFATQSTATKAIFFSFYLKPVGAEFILVWCFLAIIILSSIFYNRVKVMFVVEVIRDTICTYMAHHAH